MAWHLMVERARRNELVISTDHSQTTLCCQKTTLFKLNVLYWVDLITNFSHSELNY